MTKVKTNKTNDGSPKEILKVQVKLIGRRDFWEIWIYAKKKI